MSNINFVTNYKNGWVKNHKILNKEKLYNSNHCASYFKYIYDKLENGYQLEQFVSTIIAYDKKNPVAVLLFFHNQESHSSFKLDFYKCSNIGTIGLYVKEEYRGKGLAKKIIREFEHNFIDFYADSYDFVTINTLEDLYPISKKYLDWFVPSSKQNCDIHTSQVISEALHNGRRGMKNYLYQKQRSKLY
jgi:GNAT superfamily N-acetyltransferase